MPSEVTEKYQLAGLDERQRGFSRPVDLQQEGGWYRATLQYETVVVSGESNQAKEAALSEVVYQLQNRGYTQLRSQLSFRGGQYLGSQEPWVEYPDPGRPAVEPVGLARWFKRVGSFLGR